MTKYLSKNVQYFQKNAGLKKICIFELGNDSKYLYLDCFKYVLSETSGPKIKSVSFPQPSFQENNTIDTMTSQRKIITSNSEVLYNLKDAINCLVNLLIHLQKIL